MFLISYLFLMIMVLISVAFLTLLERKILSYIQIRKGPNKVGIMGLLSPFSDGLKLFFKEQNYPYMSNYIIYYLSPILMLIVSMILWLLLPKIIYEHYLNYMLLFYLSCASISIYGLLMCSWSSNSMYSLLGCLRSIAQMISYEVSMSLILICMFIFIYSFNFIQFMIYQKYFFFFFFSFPIFFCWFSTCLAETNRSPFDFAEGESELVSGFNVEYSGASFAFIFLSEYMNIIFLSLLSCIIFFGCDINSILFYLKMLMLMFMFIWIRGTLPRFRYDKLMYLTWKKFLPMSLNYLLFFSGMLFYLWMGYF
uniref:NADH-ubiquinone oxidoreductase chain 1 n=1 Tax=Stenopirates sp. PJ-2015 TaxID=1663424 RepID=A0A342D278_9HEMI|nr:NADH dehydrogenase subunit 1 [Stenopirates sp. PJ-2015]